MKRKQKVTIITHKSNSDNSDFMIILNSKNIIIFACGYFGGKFKRHCLQFTRKISVRNESRTQHIKTYDCETSEIQILKQVDSWKVKRPCVTKISNGQHYLKNDELKLIGKDFFKMMFGHYFKMNGGYEQDTKYI